MSGTSLYLFASKVPRSTQRYRKKEVLNRSGLQMSTLPILSLKRIKKRSNRISGAMQCVLFDKRGHKHSTRNDYETKFVDFEKIPK